MSKWNQGGWISLCLLCVLILGGCTGQTSHQKEFALEPRSDSDPKAADFIKEGNRLFSKREFREAAKKYEGAITVQPSLGEAHYNLGLALHKQGHYTESHPHFVKAAKLEPLNPVIRNAPPFRQYGTVETDTQEQAPDGHYGHQH